MPKGESAAQPAISMTEAHDLESMRADRATEQDRASASLALGVASLACALLLFAMLASMSLGVELAWRATESPSSSVALAGTGLALVVASVWTGLCAARLGRRVLREIPAASAIPTAHTSARRAVRMGIAGAIASGLMLLGTVGYILLVIRTFPKC